MPLTPEDVHKKTFTPVRLREGYDMGEVDQFLDEVEVELTRLEAENEDLRSKLAAATSSVSAQPMAGEAPSAKPATGEESQAEPASSAAEGPVLPAVRTVPEASGAAARLLEIAAQNADQLVSEAHDDADKIVGEARTNAERLQSEAKTKAEQLDADTRSRSERLDSEITERRQQVFDQLERDRDNLTSELEDLRVFEREYRSRLKSYFQQQLEALDGNSEPGATHPNDEQPTRMGSPLVDEEESPPNQ